MNPAVNLVVRAVELWVRPMTLRLPFKFGANTLTACPQLFVRVSAEVEGQGMADGWAAEMMVPKWFDKRADRSAERNIDDLALSTRAATGAYLDDAPATPFGLHARHGAALLEQARAAGLTDLSAGFGPALIDRAVIDALCRALGVSFFEAAQRNALGLCDAGIAPDLAGWDWPGWLATLAPARRIEARHTVGLLDELDSVRFGDDGLPVTLRAVIERYGHTCFKIKLGGNPAGDLERLRAVLGVLDATVGSYRYTVDGNEQYADRAALEALLAGLRAFQAPLYIEQPLPRELSLAAPLPASPGAPLLMDEADGTLSAFVQGRALGWTGVSSKGCKGVYKALINRARCERWNRDAAGAAPVWFMSAEDLTCQAGLAVQQDLALATLLGLTHCERNGHHYVDGFGAAPRAEQAAFAVAHPDLYDHNDAGGDAHGARLRIRGGQIALDSLHGPGFAHSAVPDATSLQPLAAA